MTIQRVAPILKEATGSGKINLTAIVNTHQYVIAAGYTEQATLTNATATGIMPEETRIWYVSNISLSDVI